MLVLEASFLVLLVVGVVVLEPPCSVAEAYLVVPLVVVEVVAWLGLPFHALAVVVVVEVEVEFQLVLGEPSVVEVEVEVGFQRVPASAGKAVVEVVEVALLVVLVVRLGVEVEVAQLRIVVVEGGQGEPVVVVVEEPLERGVEAVPV